jgi:glycosyltransferase involved in cell wall biosynthesis
LRLKIVLLQRVLPAYREPLFEALREQTRQAGHSFELWVSPASGTFARRGTEGRLPWARSLVVSALPAWLGGLEYQALPWREVLAADVVIAPDSARCVSNILVLLLRRLWGKRVLTWGHGANFQPGAMSRLLVPFRYLMLHLANGHLVYTQACVTALLAAGFDRGHMGVTENAVDETLAAGLHAQHPEVLAFREAHGLGDAPCVVFLGSWYTRKRPQVVVEVGLALRQQVPQVRVLVIGGGDGLELLAAQATQLSWLALLGPLHGRDKFVALAAARCLAVSGVAGLNLLDAMAIGLPVVLPQRADHSPEVAYVLDGVNGLVVPDAPARLAEACCRLIDDTALHEQLREGARQTSAASTVQAMAGNILHYAVELPDKDKGPVVFVYQRMLPYHQARFTAVAEALRRQGRACVAVEVASFDRGYGQLSDASMVPAHSPVTAQCLFPATDYLDLTPRQVSQAVCDALRRLAPSTVFAPAPAFAEGAGALHYKVRHGGRLVLMDDAWSMTDHRSQLTRWVKRIFYGYVDGGFFPDRLHGEYFAALNIPYARQRYPVDVVGPMPVGARLVEEAATGNPEPYVLFVGRLIQRKGLDVLLRAIAGVTPAVRLVVIGDGPERDALQTLGSELGLDDRVQWLGRCSNTTARLWMAQALALLVPSEFEQWGLVVNEAWMAPTLVLGSDTVGALRAAYKNEMHWMLMPAGDVVAWQRALSCLLALRPEERAVLMDETRRLAEKYSLATHTQSALELIDLPQRAWPMAPAGWLARAWRGRVAVW